MDGKSNVEIKEYNDEIMTILITYDEDKIKEILKRNGFGEHTLFSVNELDDGKFDVTLGFNSFGEDVCSKKFNTHLDAYRFSVIRTILSYDVISY